jgi:hypothetical protein
MVCGTNAGEQGYEQCDGDNFDISNYAAVWQNAGPCPNCATDPNHYPVLCNGVSTALLDSPCQVGGDSACSPDRMTQLTCDNNLGTWRVGQACGAANCGNAVAGSPGCPGPMDCVGCGL